jgi:hypothetical protein
MLPDGAGDGIESLLDHGYAGKQPVAIAVQCFDGGRYAADFTFARLRYGLKLLRLPCQIGCAGMVLPEGDPGSFSGSVPGLVRQDCEGDSCDRAEAPGSEAPQDTAVERALVGQKSAQPAATVVGRFLRRFFFDSSS